MNAQTAESRLVMNANAQLDNNSELESAKCHATHHKSLMQLEIAHAQVDKRLSNMNQDALREQHLTA
jgi:hypothetical protein